MSRVISVYLLRLYYCDSFRDRALQSEFPGRFQLITVALAPADRKQILRVDALDVTGDDLHTDVQVNPHQAVHDLGDGRRADLVRVVRVNSLQLHAFLKLVNRGRLKY